MQLEVVVFDGVPQVVFETEPIERPRVHVGVEHLVPRLAARLGVIHRRVGVAHDLFGVGVVGQAERDADARRREHLAPADRKRRAERVLDPERDRVGLRGLDQAVEENRELVAAQPGQRVTGAQARLEPPRHGNQQIVAHQVTQAVVHELEAIEIEIERREPPAAMLLEILEPLPEPLDEHRAVAQPRQRIAEPAAQPVLRDRALGVGHRSGDPRGPPLRVTHRHTATEESAIRAVLVANAMLELHMIRLAGQMLAKRLFERFDIVGMDAIEPIRGTPARHRRRQADHSPEPWGERELLGFEIPLPQPVVDAFGDERHALFDSPQRLLRPCPLADVVPEHVTPSSDGRILIRSSRPSPTDFSSTDARVRARRSFSASAMARGSAVWLRTGTAPTSDRPTARSRGQSTMRASASFQCVTRPRLSRTAMP